MKKLALSALALALLVAPLATTGEASAQTRAPASQHEVQKKPIQHQSKQTQHASWRKGAHYKGKRQVVDYKRYHLHAPSRGQEWVRVDGNYLLISIASGVIAGIAAAH
ncbi:RcnB family protein [Consotaella aegiceratis]|uniref:RcnB family protein n=1 Tax=Consotaella aegiceratis TaxID=3097961 RepID=UPI002F3EDA20